MIRTLKNKDRAKLDKLLISEQKVNHTSSKSKKAEKKLRALKFNAIKFQDKFWKEQNISFLNRKFIIHPS